MSKKVILADGSYTIRRIVELSFEGEEDYELITIDNGTELKEKLEVIKPHVVVVDVNLPEINGYDICEYINTNDTLNNIKVILLKGSFEPIDENRLGNLKYEEIIQKPFESNQFMETVKRVADKFVIPEPTSLPEEEDISNINFNDNEDISFSDVKEELEKDDVNIEVNPGELTEDNNDVMPSEEITQGSLSEHEDKLIEDKVDEINSNPFSDEKLVEEDNINQDNFNTVYKSDNEVDINKGKELDLESETESIDSEKKVDDNIQISTDIEDNTSEKEKMDKEFSEENVEINEEPIDEKIEEENVIEKPYEFGNSEDLSNEDTKQEIGKKDLLMDTQDEDTFDNMDFVSGDKIETKEDSELIQEKEKQEDISNINVKEEAEEKEITDNDEIKESTAEIETNIGSDILEEDFSGSINNLEEKEEDFKGKEEIFERKEIVTEEISEEKIDETFGVETKEDIVSEEKEKTEEVITKFGDEISKEEILDRIEGKLTEVVKEILWEVLPPIAEKIIKEEIERIREELSKLQ